jgi:hypothetical protein
MNRRAVFALAMLACAPVVASAQTAAPPIVRVPHLSVSADRLQRAADQRWDAVLAADDAYMRALRTAVAAEINARRARGEDVTELMAEQARLQEMQMSFSMQYLMLQQQMQNENRQYTMVSNIMRTKHDTVQNSISNVR